ncbi:MAG: hypothetical protein C0404_00080 [Verrucomicrobia bacterium]|nr:hypothetical protein [Verrucomicrobiota bacterium]
MNILTWMTMAACVSLILATGCVTNAKQHGACCPADNATWVQKAPLATAMKIDLSVPAASAKDGVAVSVSLKNKGPDPVSLQVCPAMTLCCVKGLHPIVSYGETGKGLLDLCRVQNPTPQRTYMPANSSFGFETSIPVSCLPEPCRQKGSEFNLSFRYDIAENMFVDSAPVKVVMGE